MGGLHVAGLYRKQPHRPDHTTEWLLTEIGCCKHAHNQYILKVNHLELGRLFVVGDLRLGNIEGYLRMGTDLWQWTLMETS